MRPGGADVGGSAGLVVLEVLDEQFREVPGLLGILGGIAPGLAGLKNIGVDVRAFGGDEHAKNRIGLERHLIESAREGGADEAARDGERETFADAVGAAGPAGVDEPDLGVVIADALFEELRVLDGRARQERRAEAATEGRGRLLDARLGAGDLGRIP